MSLFIPSLGLSREDSNNLGGLYSHSCRVLTVHLLVPGSTVERGDRPGDAPSGPCYVNQLAPERLSRVFQLGIALWTDSGIADGVADEQELHRARLAAACRVPFMSVVSQVCRYWRDVAIATPSLWTSITIAPPTPYRRIAYFLKRSGDLPIDIDCTTLSSRVYALLLAHVHRWRSMKMTFLRSESMEEFLKAASRSSIPAAVQLTTLQLQLDMHELPSRSADETYPPESYLTLFGGLAPRLERITFWAVHVDWSQHWISSAPNLTHLDLGFHLEEPCLYWPQLVTILQGSPKLKKLSLRGIEPWGAPQDPTPDSSIQLLDLTDLVLGDPAISCSLHLLYMLYVPALKSLGLDFMYDDYGDIILRIASISVTGPEPDALPRTLLSGLEKFKVLGLPCRKEDVETLYGGLQNIKSLNLSLHDLPHFLKLLAKPCPLAGQDVWLPRLETVYLTDAYSCAHIIREVLREREKLGYPIKSLYVDRCYSADENLPLSGLKEDVESFSFYNEVYATVM